MLSYTLKNVLFDLRQVNEFILEWVLKHTMCPLTVILRNKQTTNTALCTSRCWTHNTASTNRRVNRAFIPKVWPDKPLYWGFFDGALCRACEDCEVLRRLRLEEWQLTMVSALRLFAPRSSRFPGRRRQLRGWAQRRLIFLATGRPQPPIPASVARRLKDILTLAPLAFSDD